MTSILDSHTDHALNTARRLAGRTVTYCRDADSESFSAIPAESAWEENQDGYAVQAAKSQDFIFETSDLGDFSLPAKGDYITEEESDGTTRRYDLLSPTAEQAWRFADRNRKWIRVHTKMTDDDVS